MSHFSLKLHIKQTNFILYKCVLQQKPNELPSQEISQELLNILKPPDSSVFFP